MLHVTLPSLVEESCIARVGSQLQWHVLLIISTQRFHLGLLDLTQPLGFIIPESFQHSQLGVLTELVIQRQHIKVCLLEEGMTFQFLKEPNRTEETEYVHFLKRRLSLWSHFDCLDGV